MSVDHHYQVQQAPTAPPPPPPLQPPRPVTLQNYAGAPSVRKPVRLPPILSSLALIIAIAALVVAIIDSIRGSQDAATPPAAAPAAPTYSAEQISAAKQQTCTAAERSIVGVRIATNRPGPNGSEDLQGQLNSATARLALLNAATYLPTQIAEATPVDIKDAANRLAGSAGDAVSAALTEGKSAAAPDGAYAKAGDLFNSTSTEVQRLCQE